MAARGARRVPLRDEAARVGRRGRVQERRHCAAAVRRVPAARGGAHARRDGAGAEGRGGARRRRDGRGGGAAALHRERHALRGPALQAGGDALPRGRRQARAGPLRRAAPDAVPQPRRGARRREALLRPGRAAGRQRGTPRRQLADVRRGHPRGAGALRPKRLRAGQRRREARRRLPHDGVQGGLVALRHRGRLRADGRAAPRLRLLPRLPARDVGAHAAEGLREGARLVRGRDRRRRAAGSPGPHRRPDVPLRQGVGQRRAGRGRGAPLPAQVGAVHGRGLHRHCQHPVPELDELPRPALRGQCGRDEGHVQARGAAPRSHLRGGTRGGGQRRRGVLPDPQPVGRPGERAPEVAGRRQGGARRARRGGAGGLHVGEVERRAQLLRWRRRCLRHGEAVRGLPRQGRLHGRAPERGARDRRRGAGAGDARAVAARQARRGRLEPERALRAHHAERRPPGGWPAARGAELSGGPGGTVLGVQLYGRPRCGADVHLPAGGRPVPGHPAHPPQGCGARAQPRVHHRHPVLVRPRQQAARHREAARQG
ncbi:cysteine peptidase, Clan CA, family C2 [Strigomonas culicis]|uniref:Cysteine peptidase, Clan CA, family C2 n=1 Tax=Strigomonas culicis TaxID=28005 RepID=S9U807_9TRYP|nr:cysteine peptidase, Clan CA, family C2 [Strigomonas culicis]|eukprot:EPY26882.1 cysteine peptidase, Clan CA, family C2 [Strigomonas culicis]